MVISSSLTTFLPGMNFLLGLGSSKPLTFKAFSGLLFLPRSSECAELSFGGDSTLSGVFVFSFPSSDLGDASLVSDGVDLVGLDAVALVVSDLGWASFLDTDWTGLATCLAAAAEEFVA